MNPASHAGCIGPDYKGPVRRNWCVYNRQGFIDARRRASAVVAGSAFTDTQENSTMQTTGIYP